MIKGMLSVLAVFLVFQSWASRANSLGGHSTAFLPSTQGSADKKTAVGVWELFVFVDGVGNDQPPVTVVIQEASNKLTGKVTVPRVEPTATGIQTAGNVNLTLEDLMFNGKKLSFQVVEEGNVMDADLIWDGENKFEGRWRSEIKGRWKGSKNEFSGTLILRRKG